MSKLSLCSTALCIGAGVLISASAAPLPGGVDPTFDPGGGALYVTPSSGRTVLIQPDGKILVTGDNNALNLEFVPAVLRFNPDGTLDQGFDASGLGVPGSYYFEYGPKVLALQANGQILVAGWFSNPDSSARYLTRLNSDGSIDATFNPEIRNGNFPASDLEASLVAGGKILIGGNFTSINGVPRTNLARLNTDGSVDPTFNAGVAIHAGISRSFVVQSTGKPVVVTNGGGDQVFRLNTDGSLDGTFATVRAPAGYLAGGLLVEPDDKVIWTAIWAGGFGDCPPTIISRVTADGTSDPAFQPFSSCGGAPSLLQQDGRLIIFSWYGGILRLNTDGSPDPSFHPIGLGSFAQQADGRLMVAGYFSSEPYPAGIRRLFLDGSNDNSFDPGTGLVWIRTVSIDQARLLPNGKIVIAGDFDYIDRTPRWQIAVLNPNGSVNADFDTGFLLGCHSCENSFHTVEVQTDGKILVALGHSLIRLNPDGRLDSTFQYNSIPNTDVWKLGLQPSGKIVLSDWPGQVLRLTPNGSLDPTFHSDQTGTLESIQPDGKVLVRTEMRLIRLTVDGALDSGYDPNPSSGFFAPTFRALQPNGMLLVSRFVNSVDSPFTRLNPDGSIDQTFNPDFRVVSLAAADLTGIYFWANVVPIGQPSQLEIGRFFFDGSHDPNFIFQVNAGAQISTLLVQPDGQLLVAGSFDHINGVPRAGIARLNGAALKKLSNISTRVRVGDTQSVEITGFIITGNMPKRVIVRALGPSLVGSGLSGSDLLANPHLELHDSTQGIIAQNDNWRDTQEAEIMASGIPPTEDVEAAIVATCAPGYYTAVVQGGDGSAGIALAEVYDLDPAADSSLANISTRGFVNTGDGVMIAGFILRGSESSTIIARAIGPSLVASGINSPLADPTLSVYDQNGGLIAGNDDWRQTQQAELEAYGMGPANDHESALIAIPPPGQYTAIVRGANSQSGVGLVEIYHVE